MKDMVGILTFHSAHNYGAVLQAYALKSAVEKLEYSCSIINYQTKNRKKQYSLININNFKFKYFLYTFQNLLNIKDFKLRKALYEQFINDFLNGKSQIISNKEDLVYNIKIYKSIIVGSDQVWNLNLDDYDDSYFLNFVKNEKRISYAASFGKKNIIYKK